MSPELQRAQDMLAAIQAQRDNALNAMVLAQAEIAGLRREIEALRMGKSEGPAESGSEPVHNPLRPEVSQPEDAQRAA